MVKSIKLESVSSRAVLIITGVVCLTAAIFFVKWCFANAIAAHAPNKEVAELTVSMAPADPQTHYALAVLNERTFSTETLTKARAEFGQATALSPNDFRLWLAYGKALERDGDAAGAELALKKALALAPNYAAVHWTLGNVLLRRGKTQEGFREIRHAAENDDNYRLAIVSMAWQFFDGNLSEVKQAIGDSTNLSAGLVVFLAKQKRLDEAFEIWTSLPAEGRTIYKTDGEQLFGELLAAKKYRKALRLQNEFNEKSDAEKFVVGKIHNGGFETELTREQASVFDWRIADGRQPQIGPNEEQKHGGSRSIFIIFNSTDGKDYRQISQTIVVESARKYIFNGFYKSNLKTAATLRWEIVDAANDAVLASVNPIAANADWTGFSVPFAISENTEAITLRLTREQCKSIICPISGNVWFDDFSITQ